MTWTQEKQAQLDALMEEKARVESENFKAVEDLCGRSDLRFRLGDPEEMAKALIMSATAFRKVLRVYDELDQKAFIKTQQDLIDTKAKLANLRAAIVIVFQQRNDLAKLIEDISSVCPKHPEEYMLRLSSEINHAWVEKNQIMARAVGEIES